jgi:hypothetical protein
MATNNSWNTPELTTNGQLLIGNTGNNPSAATLTAGTNISVTNGGGTITIAGTGAASFTWNNSATGSVALVANNGYLANNGSLITFTLPATAAQLSIIRIAGYGAGGWTIAQASGQEIFFGSVHTTSGASGSLSSSNQYDQVNLLCTVANTTWVVMDALGNLTYV